jgi:hypothetical protein
MPLYITKLKALDPTDGELKEWAGPHIEAISYSHAREICIATGRGYLMVDAKLEREIAMDGTVLLDARQNMN